MLAVALVAVAGIAPDDASAESLREALASAYTYNPRLDAERARLRASDEEVPRAHSRPSAQPTSNSDSP